MSDEFFKVYMEYVGRNEAPLNFHRWSSLGITGAAISRNLYISFGHERIYPNQYVLLIGTPGTRKGTAIKHGLRLLKHIGYNNFAPNKAAKETLWSIMAATAESDEEDEDNMLDMVFDKPTEMFIGQDEFVDFTGIGNDDLITNLANLWDNLPSYDNPKQTKKSVSVTAPTVSILSGATPGGLAECFSGLAQSGGFFSRVLFIHGEPTGTKITWPDPPNEEAKEVLAARLLEVVSAFGEITLNPNCKHLIDHIYRGFPGMNDARFAYYAQRRLTHLLKLIIILTAQAGRMDATEEDIIRANTILHLAEQKMTNALGEFGKARNSSVVSAILEMLKTRREPLDFITIWKAMSTDLNKPQELRDIMQNLLQAEKIQSVKTPMGSTCYLPKILLHNSWDSKLIDYSLVMDAEHPDVRQLKEVKANV